MASIRINNLNIDIVVHNIDGMLDQVFHIPFKKGFWVLLNVKNLAGESESFPSIDEDYRIKIYESYSDAIDDIARLLKKLFAQSS